MNTEMLLSLHRHWVWADRMKELFEFYLKKEGLPSPESLAPTQPYLLSSMFTCMSLWYGLLYVTCEGIENAQNVNICDIAPAYPKNKASLRRFRNAMCHVQPKYWTPKLFNILKDANVVDDIRSIHEQVGEWLKSQLRSHIKNTE